MQATQLTKYLLRDFLTADYLPTSTLRMNCVKPRRCPSSNVDCQIWSKGFRERKCGPGFRLSLFRCQTHGISFTVYPIGWVPYSRSSYAPNINDENSSLYSSDCAVSGTVWPEVALFSKQDFRWTLKTQKRQIFRWSSLFSIDLQHNDSERWQAASTLQCPTQVLIDGANQVRAGPTFSGRARAILDVLNKNKNIDVHHILRRGFEGRTWGCPIYYDSSSAPSLSGD